MRQRASVQNDRHGARASAVHRFYEVALEVGLEVSNAEPVDLGGVAEAPHVLIQRLGPVDLGTACSQFVQVRARQQKYLVTHCSPRKRSSTWATTTGSISRTTSKPFGPARTNARSWCAFLSRAIASTNPRESKTRSEEPRVGD